MEQSPSSEVAVNSTAQESTNILWTSDLPHLVHKSLPLGPILSQINPIHTAPHFQDRFLILSYHLRFCIFISGFFPFLLRVLPIKSRLT
jgi:hypothetical protein